ncbi:MAG: hypothetical protein NT047_00805 [Deltaproteobacteria bacterium]|nr:hypothetical protein [Deltaproteobacteria bacterium]
MTEKKNDEEMQTTPDLDQAMRDGRITFDGEGPAEAAAPLQPGTLGPDEKTDKGETGKEEEGTKKAEEKPGTEGQEPAPGGKKPDADAAHTKEGDTPSETAFRFKSHPEAERGYKELQGRTTKAEQRAKDAEDELNRIKNADQIKADKDVAKAKIVDFATERKAQALTAIDELDPEDPEYRKNAAKILSTADIDIFDHYREHGTKAPATAAEEKPVRGKPAGDTPADDQVDEVYRYTQGKITDEGLEPTDPLFWTFAREAPVTDAKGERTPLDTQIAWAVSQTKLYHEKIQAKTKEADEAASKRRVLQKQEQDIPLGRTTMGGGETPAGKTAETDKSVSLADAVESALEQRRL